MHLSTTNIRLCTLSILFKVLMSDSSDFFVPVVRISWKASVNSLSYNSENFSANLVGLFGSLKSAIDEFPSCSFWAATLLNLQNKLILFISTRLDTKILSWSIHSGNFYENILLYVLFCLIDRRLVTLEGFNTFHSIMNNFHSKNKNTIWLCVYVKHMTSSTHMYFVKELLAHWT